MGQLPEVWEPEGGPQSAWALEGVEAEEQHLA